MASGEQPTARWTRRIGLGVLVLFGSVWAGGSAVALMSATFPEGACLAPFRAWALGWPIFWALPDAGRDAYVAWSMSLCR